MTAEDYLNLACKNIPVINRVIQEYGDIPLSDYLKNLILKPVPSYQPQDDFLKVVYQYAASLMGESVARQAAHDLEEYPVILTSNHLGVEYFSQSLQSSILFALGKSSVSAKTAPVFSFGNIPLNNLTYPRGALLYHICPGEINNMPLRLPIFPDRFKRGIAGIVPGFDYKMIQKADSRLDKMLEDKQISQTIATAMHKIFQEDYCADSVMKLLDYSQQSVIMNRRIWNRLFSEPDAIPELIYLEIEKIASTLLEYDLSDRETLAWRVMFDSAIKEKLFEELDGVNGCWERKKLEQRLKTRLSDKSSGSGGGTIFFWGIDDYLRRIPFYLETNSLNDGMLIGIDDHGKIWKIPFTPETIIEKLKEKQLIPSLFTTFLTISLARGLVCLGGYFQAAYLPAMQRGVVKSLQNRGDNNSAAIISQVPTDGYLSGMLAVMTKTEDDYLIPAGAAEIIASGSITDDEIDKILYLTVRDAHIAGLFETIPDAVPRELRPADWKKDLAKESEGHKASRLRSHAKRGNKIITCSGLP